MENICARAMLVSLSVSTWTARKYDKTVTAQINADHAASSDAGRYNKLLLPGDADSYRAIMRAAGAVRTEHYRNSLAWTDEGWRLLPTKNYMAYADMIRKHASMFDSALETFLTDYPYLRDQSRTRLNGMYKDSDYPDVYDLRNKFSMGVEYTPVPASGDFRLDLPADTIADITRTVESRVRKSVDLAVKDSWNRLVDCVRSIHTRLSDPKAIFRDSLIKNAHDLTDVLKRLNVTDDPALEHVRQTIETQLGTLTPSMLRADPVARAQVATDAKSILDTMSSIYQGAA